MKLAVVVLTLLALGAVLADFLAPYRPEEQDTRRAYAPPTTLRFLTSEGFSLRPCVFRIVEAVDPDTLERTFTEIPSERYAVRFFVRGTPYRLFGFIPCDLHLFGLGDDAARAGVHITLWGADRLGRDVFTRTLFGARLSLAVGPYILLLLLPLALAFGGISGILGGWVDQILQRVGEVIGSLPTLPVLLVVGAATATWSALPLARTLVVLGALTAISWTGMARVIRGQVLSLREREFVLAARACGATELGILVRDVLPHVATTAIVGGALLLPGAMLLEASLSFLGFGVPEPTPSWGTLLASARSLSALSAAPWLLIPGGFIALATLSFTLVGDALRDAADALDAGRRTPPGASRRVKKR